MHTRFALAALMAISFGLTSPTSAQSGGSIEFGAFGRFTQFDNSLSFSDRVGAGGRLGFFITRNVELEAAAGFTSTSSAGRSVDYYPIYGRLVYNAPVVPNLSLLIGGGFVQNIYRGALRGADNGASALAGFRVFLTNELSLRFEGVGDFTPNPTNNAQGASNNLHLGAQAGVSLHFGNVGAARTTRPARRGGTGDADRDGVADGSDSCPNTAPGTPVDRVGCPIPVDSDEDGVFDNEDRCPNTPLGARVDNTGCEIRPGAAEAGDADRDGVTDANDSCPNTPAGTPVDAIGCPVSTDSDGDGVPDASDICANTPAGVGVDARGCPADSDRDGVADSVDRCPGTPAGTYVGPDGCATLLPADNRPVVLEGVNFASGSAAITGSSAAVLDWVARALTAETGILIEIGGHTDNSGARLTNLSLSQRRADAVRSYLIQRGVPPSQMVARGYGPDSPIASNATASGRARNRRVELRRIN